MRVAAQKVRRAVLYLRVSRGDKQDPEAQAQALRAWCAERGWRVVGQEVDRVSGDPARRRGDPPGLSAALRSLTERRADLLVVFAVDRLVRSPLELLQLVGRVRATGAHVASYSDGGDVDTTTDAGELLLFLRGWWARMELRITRARTVAGLQRARAAGRVGGRPRAQLPELAQVAAARAEGLSLQQMRARLGCSLWAVRQAVKQLPNATPAAPQLEEAEHDPSDAGAARARPGRPR